MDSSRDPYPQDAAYLEFFVRNQPPLDPDTLRRIEIALGGLICDRSNMLRRWRRIDAEQDKHYIFVIELNMDMVTREGDIPVARVRCEIALMRRLKLRSEDEPIISASPIRPCIPKAIRAALRRAEEEHRRCWSWDGEDLSAEHFVPPPKRSLES